MPGTGDQDYVSLLSPCGTAVHCPPPPFLLPSWLCLIPEHSFSAEQLMRSYFTFFSTLRTNHASPCAGNSPSSWFSGSTCRKNIVTFLRRLRDTELPSVA